MKFSFTHHLLWMHPCISLCRYVESHYPSLQGLFALDCLLLPTFIQMCPESEYSELVSVLHPVYVILSMEKKLGSSSFVITNSEVMLSWWFCLWLKLLLYSYIEGTGLLRIVAKVYQSSEEKMWRLLYCWCRKVKNTFFVFNWTQHYYVALFYRSLETSALLNATYHMVTSLKVLRFNFTGGVAAKLLSVIFTLLLEVLSMTIKLTMKAESHSQSISIQKDRSFTLLNGKIKEWIKVVMSDRNTSKTFIFGGGMMKVGGWMSASLEDFVNLEQEFKVHVLDCVCVCVFAYVHTCVCVCVCMCMCVNYLKSLFQFGCTKVISCRNMFLCLLIYRYYMYTYKLGMIFGSTGV